MKNAHEVYFKIKIYSAYSRIVEKSADLDLARVVNMSATTMSPSFLLNIPILTKYFNNVDLTLILPFH